jgi:hypothetical protein
MTKLVITIWHNVARDVHGRHTGFAGFTPGDEMVKVFSYETESSGRTAEQIAEHAFTLTNDAPDGQEAIELARQYRARQLRSVSVGDLVVVGEIPLTVERAGWAPLRGAITEVSTDEHGSHPLPPEAVSPREATGHQAAGQEAAR